MKKLLFFMSLFVITKAIAQDRPAYVLYNSQGKKITYNKMLKELASRDVVLFGEYHNNPIVHWLQLIVTKDLHQKRPLILGAEMFERDNQEALDQYTSGAMNAKQFEAAVRLWNNYKTDYAPLVNFARENKLAFIGTNIPRRYAWLVSKGGFEVLDTLPEQDKKWLAPMPIAYDSSLPGYKNMIAMMGGHGSQNFPKAQAIKDATMAHFILQNYKAGSLLIHFNGAYHSDNYEGILWYLQRQQPELRYATITTVLQKDIRKLEEANKKKADFIICVDADMTTTY
jgi:uncharacterized iron-regulated protein